MSEENKTVRDLKPEKDVKGGDGTSKVQPETKGTTKSNPGPNPLPPIPGTN